MWSSARCSVSVQDSWCSRPAVHLPKTRGAFSGTSVFGGSDPAPTSREPALSWAHARNHCPAPPVECPGVNQGLSTQRPSLQPPTLVLILLPKDPRVICLGPSCPPPSSPSS